VQQIHDRARFGLFGLDEFRGLDDLRRAAKLVLNILGSIAQFERNLTLERTRAGLAAARAKGRVGDPLIVRGRLLKLPQ